MKKNWKKRAEMSAAIETLLKDHPPYTEEQLLKASDDPLAAAIFREMFRKRNADDGRRRSGS